MAGRAGVTVEAMKNVFTDWEMKLGRPLRNLEKEIIMMRKEDYDNLNLGERVKYKEISKQLDIEAKNKEIAKRIGSDMRKMEADPESFFAKHKDNRLDGDNGFYN